MTLQGKYSIYRKIAVFMAINLLVEIITPTAVWALTGGPSSPEFSSFEPVATTNMVNDFTGDLTYNLPVINVPGANGGGYAMSLSYHSGTTPEEESSWVGYGWTLNPGAINRNKKGTPDDWKGKSVKYHNKTPANETVAIGGSLGNFEGFSYDLPASVNSSIRYNNYNGFGYSYGIGLSLFKGVVSLGFNVSDGSGSFSLALNPAKAMGKGKDNGEKSDKKTTASQKRIAKRKEGIIDKLNKKDLKRDTSGDEKMKVNNRGALSGMGSGYGLHNFASASRPTQIVGYEGISTTLSLGLMITPTGTPISYSANMFGSYSKQENTPETNLNTYGYMYSADAGSDDMMDYFVEKGSVYTKQDKFLGIPFNNADNYTLTGEGLGGGFKLYNKYAGHFHPNYIKSSTNILNVGAEIEAGLNNGGGADIGVGHQSLEISEWKSPESNNGFSKDQDESNFFRFANDKGGYVSYDNGNKNAKQASLQTTSSIIGSKNNIPNTSHITKTLDYNNSYNRALRSSYIGYNTNSEMNDDFGGVDYRAYNKNVESHISSGSIDRSDGNQVGEFSITNEDGSRYNYSLPVLSKEEKNLQVDLKGVTPANIHNKFLVYRDITGSTETKVGEERNASYATSYLLTDITSPDYIDRTNNGTTEDDFGGYTKFIYNKVYGEGKSIWYKWRMPYAGLSYNRNELSNPKDDLGSVAEGYKEVYYLDTVETKTHYAVFHISDRDDGIDAAHSEYTASTTSGAKGTSKLKKLDKIELFAKNNLGSDKLIKTVHFKYDYTLCDGVLNNDNSTGKLTLKKMWFEYNGAVDAKISPYQFQYEYPSTNYPSRYDSFENYGSYSSLEENPNYSPFNIDAWGNYQYDGGTRFQDMKPWLDQSGSNDANFDPAAWQLKVIKLPSGGEIHVQYEQDDYCYVQNQAAQAMVSLIDGNHSSGEFHINTVDLGITSTFEKQQLAALIHKEYVVGGKKMYFKMLYKLIGNAVPHIDDCNVEYVTGYADVQAVVYNLISGRIEIQLKQGGYTLPQQVCEDYVTTQRAGNLSFVGSNCNPSENSAINGGSATDKVVSFLGQAITWLGSLAPNTTCLEVNYPYSYLKIPLLNAKKGGGVRVKRLLMYDKGIDSGTPVLYGSEYIYKAYDEERKGYRSSGVATNEPSSIREENALVGFMDRFKQGWLDKVISGTDKENSEGPLGESLLPGPSVGYSRIITKSIHSGKTNPGFAIKEYYTAKEKPITIGMAEDDNSDVMTTMKTKKDYLPIITGLINKITNNLWVSQGFVFELNNMHGQMKSSSTYAGDYADILNPNTSTLVSQETVSYFEPEEELPILDPTDLSYSNTMPLGREMDMVFYNQKVSDINMDGNIEFDADVGFFGIVLLPFLSAFPTMTYTETELYTHTTTKIINYPAVVKSTKSYADGIYHITENVAFNPENGQPIMTRTTDGFDDLNLLASANHDGDYTNYKFPGSLAYENVSQKAKNERKVVNGTTGNTTIKKIIENGKSYLSFSATPPNTVCGAMSNFVGGDLIKLPSGVYHSGGVYGSKIEILPTNYSNVGSASAGAINVEIIRSGRTNQLNMNIGSVTTYGKDSVIITPVDSATLALRKSFADMLTAALLQDTIFLDTIFADSIPGGIELLNADGSCTPLDNSHFILVEGNQVNIYGPGIPINQDTVIVGTPGSPHPMVDSLNSYLTTFYDYELDTAGAILQCGNISSGNPNVIDVNNSSVLTMVSEQNNFLSMAFDDVNGANHSINDYFVETGIVSGYARTTVDYSLLGIVNRRVLLEEIATGKTMGANLGCVSSADRKTNPLYCTGCSLEAPFDTTICSTKDIVGIGHFEEDTLGYLVFKKGDNIYCPTDVRFYELEGGDVFPELICSSELEMSGDYGSFEIDPKTASLVYYAGDNPCYAQDVPCIRFCSEYYPSTAITNVVASEASTLSDEWGYNENLYSATGNNYEMGKKGKWRTKSTYAFKTDVDRLTSSPTSYDKNYNSGTYNLELFNWEILNANGPKWLELNTVNTYSPNGNALEEENILGIKSAAKFGYNYTLPYLIAQNSDYSSVMFESFENSYSGGSTLEDGIVLNPLDGSIDYTEAHSGSSSFKLTFPSNDGVEMTEMTITNQHMNKGILFKVWVKTDFNDRTIIDDYLKADLKDVGNNITFSQSFNKVAQAGEWYLYEARILPAHLSGFTVGNTLKTYVNYQFTSHGSENIWIDDVRIQPMDAQVTTYVYDVITHRLLTTFDDQHFGLFYQYNAEGKLVRKLIETEKGLKTVQETQYHNPTENR